MTKQEGIRKTSDEWQKLSNTIVIDPDGWDRKGDFRFSWFEELITEEEYKRRETVSSCAMRGCGFD